MRMQVVDIRKVGVAMCEPGMAVHMGVRFHPIPRKIVVVLVMGIVPVPVPMGHFFMVMPVGMVFRQMEPNAHTHQRSGQPEAAIGGFTEYANRNRCTHKGCDRKIGTGAGGAKPAKCQNKQYQA